MEGVICQKKIEGDCDVLNLGSIPNFFPCFGTHPKLNDVHPNLRDVPHVNVRGGDGAGNHGRDVLDVNVRGGRLDRTCLMVAVRR